MCKTLEALIFFITLTLKQVFWKIKRSFEKLEYRFLVESTTMENVTFPYKSVLSKAYVKINRMGSTKYTYHKEWCRATNYFFFENFILLHFKANLI